MSVYSQVFDQPIIHKLPMPSPLLLGILLKDADKTSVSTTCNGPNLLRNGVDGVLPIIHRDVSLIDGLTKSFKYCHIHSIHL